MLHIRGGLFLKPPEKADETLRVLAGLVRSGEREAGALSRVVARVTSLLVRGLASLLGSKVYGLWSNV